MGRITGSKNQKPAIVPHTVKLSAEEKIEFLATLIVDRITEDLNDGQKLLKRIEGEHEAELRAAA